MKKYGEEEIRKFNERKAALDHSIISNAGEDAILDDLQNKYIEQIKTENKTVGEYDTSKLLVENNPEMTDKHVESIKTEIDKDIVNRIIDTELIEIENIPIVNVAESDGVTDGVNEEVQSFPSIPKKIYTTNIEKEPFGWNGQSGNTENEVINQIEVKLEDLPSGGKNLKENVVIKPIEIHPNTEKIKNVSEIEKKLIEPDEVPSKQKHVIDMLREISKNQ